MIVEWRINMKYDIICAGSAVTDILAYHYDPEHFATGHVPCEYFKLSMGGNALNNAVIMTRLGKKACLVARIGRDYFGDGLAEFCRDNGVEDEWLIRDEHAMSSVSVVLVDKTGERAFVTNEQGSIRMLEAEDLDFDKLPDAKAFILSCMLMFPKITPEKAEVIYSEAKRRGMITAMDISRLKEHETDEVLSPIFPHLDYFFLNRYEANYLTGKSELPEMADSFLRWGVKNVIIKTGAEGCYVKNATSELYVPAYEETKCIDTTGAGDTFAGAFLTAILDGADVREAAMFGNAAASITVESLGAVTGLQHRSQVEERFKALKNQIK